MTAAVARRARRGPSPGTRRNLVAGLLFISPWLVGFVAFYLYPALASLYYSFTDFKILEAPRWVGLDNYARLGSDPLFWKSLGNTLYLALFGLPLSVLSALAIAPVIRLNRMAGLIIGIVT